MGLREEYESGATLRELSERHAISEETLRRRLHALGTTMRPRGHGGRYRPSGGRIVDKAGYVLVLMPTHPRANSGGYVREHRLVMERVLGRSLAAREVVHHLNGRKDDNRPENLRLYASNGEHKREDMAGNAYSRTEKHHEAMRRAETRAKTSAASRRAWSIRKARSSDARRSP